MAIVYNDNDLNAAVNELMPGRNSLLYPGPHNLDAANILSDLIKIEEIYKHELWAFQSFNKLTQEMKSKSEVMNEVNKHLLAAQMGL